MTHATKSNNKSKSKKQKKNNKTRKECAHAHTSTRWTDHTVLSLLHCPEILIKQEFACQRHVRIIQNATLWTLWTAFFLISAIQIVLSDSKARRQTTKNKKLQLSASTAKKTLNVAINTRFFGELLDLHRYCVDGWQA